MPSHPLPCDELGRGKLRKALELSYSSIGLLLLGLLDVAAGAMAFGDLQLSVFPEDRSAAIAYAPTMRSECGSAPQ
jgi:hypothetical protein